MDGALFVNVTRSDFARNSLWFQLFADCAFGAGGSLAEALIGAPADH